MTAETDVGVIDSQQREEIVRRWYTNVRAMVSPAMEADAFRRQLHDLTCDLVGCLIEEPFVPRRGREAGKSLACMPYIPAEVLGRTIETLTIALGAALADAHLAHFRPRVPVLLGEMATGFLQQRDENIRTDQHSAHAAYIAARRNADEARQAADARYRAVVSEAAEGIVLVDAESTRVVESNASFQRMMGYSAAELEGMPFHHIVERRRETVVEGFQRTLQEGRRDVGERLCRRKDGTAVLVESSGAAIQVAGQSLLCIVMRDITERRRMEAKLERAKRALAARSEEERATLARELHDGAVQDLAGLSYQLESVRRRIPDDARTAHLRAQLREVETEISGVIRQLRRLISELRPDGLADGSLDAILSDYVAAVARRQQRSLSTDVQVALGVERLEPELSLCLFRVAQEAVRNAVQHGCPGRLAIRLRRRNSGVILRVADNGCGFVVPDRLDLARGGHYGLLGMAERVGQVEGRMRVRSRPGQGTTITVWAPLHPAEDEGNGDAPHPPG